MQQIRTTRSTELFTSQSLGLPNKPETRDAFLNVRMTNDERDAISRLAHRFNVTPSHLARHFLKLAVDHYEKSQEATK